MGIYSYELYKFYDVNNIIRIGTTGAYEGKADIRDIILVDKSYSDSNYAKIQSGFDDNIIMASENLNKTIFETAKENNIETKTGTIYSSDVFYNQIKNEEYKKYNCIGVEMESFALFANSKLLSKNAACILTVSNIINNEKSELSAEERERSLNKMIKLALESSRHMEWYYEYKKEYF